MAEHTPGPWEVVWQDDIARIRLNGSSVYAVKDITDPDYPLGKPRYCLADLHLMAAAPELLLACKRMREMIQDIDRALGRKPGLIFDAMGAIMKAENISCWTKAHRRING